MKMDNEVNSTDMYVFHTKRKWTDSLSEFVYQRLANCYSRKADILPLAQARWNFIKSKEGFTKEDALIDVLELLDCNGCWFDLTNEEFEGILAKLV